MPKTIFLAAAQPPNSRRVSAGEDSVPNTLRYTEVINTEDRTIGKKGISHKEMYEIVHANSTHNPGFTEVENIVTRTLEVLEIIHQDEASSQDLFIQHSTYPH